VFWRMALPALRQGRIDELIASALVAHHMITFARECTAGQQSAAFYADRPSPAPAITRAA
jgi:hopanoid C-2 methylase